MGITSVVGTFAMCFIFNIFLPTGDVGSDLNLMHQALTFDLGSSLVLEGCKSCYHKTERELYHHEQENSKRECNICLYQPGLMCGQWSVTLQKIREMESERDNCLIDESYRFTKQAKFVYGECDEDNDQCCVSKAKEKKISFSIHDLDRKKLFWPCFTINEDLDNCFVTELGKRCERSMTDEKWREQYLVRVARTLLSPKNETTIFYPYSRMNQSWEFGESQLITKPDVECGILMYRHNRNDSQRQQRVTQKYRHYCNDDSCLTHLRYLNYETAISDLNKWRKSSEYVNGARIGGLICELLQIYGASILIPILLNLTFSIILFVNDFRDKKANWFEMIPVVFLVYPQYKTLKFLAQFLLIHQNENLLFNEKEEYDKTVGTIEPFLESCFQVF